MTEPVKRYVTTCDCMNEAGWGDYVRHADYASLEQECERLRSEQGAETFLTLTGEIVKAKTERDAALKLLAQCRGLLHPHRHAELRRRIYEALQL